MPKDKVRSNTSALCSRSIFRQNSEPVITCLLDALFSLCVHQRAAFLGAHNHHSTLRPSYCNPKQTAALQVRRLLTGLVKEMRTPLPFHQHHTVEFLTLGFVNVHHQATRRVLFLSLIHI